MCLSGQRAGVHAHRRGRGGRIVGQTLDRDAATSVAPGCRGDHQHFLTMRADAGAQAPAEGQDRGPRPRGKLVTVIFLSPCPKPMRVF
jgi:hypothetical protein